MSDYTSFADSLGPSTSHNHTSKDGTDTGYTSFPQLKEKDRSKIREVWSQKNSGKLMLSGLGVIILSVFERLFLKRLLDHLGTNFGMLMTHIVALCYVIGFGGYALYRRFKNSDHRPFVEVFTHGSAGLKAAAFALAFSDTLATICLVTQHRHMPGARFVLLIQAAIPFTVLVGYKQAFHLWHFVGAFASFFGILFPLGFDSQKVEGSLELPPIILLLCSAFFTATSAVLQDYIIKDEHVDVYSLHSWTAIWGLIFSICLSPVTFVFERLGTGDFSMSEIFKNYPDGLLCALSAKQALEVDDCKWNILTLALYLVTAFCLNVGIGLVFKYGSGRAVSHCLVAHIPLSYVVFSVSIPWLNDSTPGMTWYGVTGCAVVVFGHYIYNKATHYQQDQALVVAMTKQTLLQSYAGDAFGAGGSGSGRGSGKRVTSPVPLSSMSSSPSSPDGTDSTSTTTPTRTNPTPNTSSTPSTHASIAGLPNSGPGDDAAAISAAAQSIVPRVPARLPSASRYTFTNIFSDAWRTPAIKFLPWKLHYTTLFASAPFVTTLIHRLRKDPRATRLARLSHPRASRVGHKVGRPDGDLRTALIPSDDDDDDDDAAAAAVA